MRRIELLNLCSNEADAIKWCQSKNLLNHEFVCNKCGAEASQISIHFMRCKNSQCRARISVTSGTIFANSRIPISIAIFLLYEWSIESTICQTAYEYSVSEKTVSIWFKRFRQLAALFASLDSKDKIGGRGEIVEIDECLIVKRKHNSGRLLQNQVWIFGGIQRGDDSRCFLEFIPNRNRETLLKIIKNRINPHTTIATDGWKAYENLPELLPEMNFEQLTVNHSENYVNPENLDAHTQNIEAFWSVLKRKLRKRGTNFKTSIKDHFGEQILRKKFGKNMFEKFIDLIVLYF